MHGYYITFLTSFVPFVFLNDSFVFKMISNDITSSKNERIIKPNRNNRKVCKTSYVKMLNKFSYILFIY